ncbi:MAG: flagellar motor protein MotB [Pseudomonadota bacterium]|nr:flagellar motor protein MotB [Pseudomonadota bacterium]
MSVGARRALVAGLVLVGLASPVAVRAGASADRDLIGQLDREIIALKQKVRILEDRLAGCASGGEVGTVYPELVQVFSGGPVAVDRVGGTTRVTLPGDLLFSSGSLALREEADFALDLLATALKLHMDLKVLLVGHTDADPPSGPFKKLFPSNWELSYSRALAVARALVEGHGVPYTRFTVAGRADLDPLTGNDTPEGRATNRRVVAHLTPGGSK